MLRRTFSTLTHPTHSRHLSTSSQPLVFRTAEAYAGWRSTAEGSVGFVPTMGALHEGHLSLVDRVKAEVGDGKVVASVFVNPSQFAPTDDLDAYPRQLEEDVEALGERGVDVVFAPDDKEMYPEGFCSWVEVDFEGGDVGEGGARPGFFRGVATVVTKLLHIVRPTVAGFGAKDAQQVMVIRQLLKDLNFGVQLVVGETVREADGLAMSSRNAYLSAEERKEAPSLYEGLREIAKRSEEAAELLSPEEATSILQSKLLPSKGWALDYVTFHCAITGKAVERRAQSKTGHIILAAAAKLGTTRLIDNIPLFGRVE